jgi:molybdopterin molybdotransferase
MITDSSIQRIARLTPLESVLALIQSRVTPVAPRRMALAQGLGTQGLGTQVLGTEALGAVLAEDVQPPHCPNKPIALRDGFAVAAAEIADAGPYAPVPLGLTACRVDVGGAMPSGTDAVVPLDAITLRGTCAEAIAPVAPGEGVLAPGGDTAPATALRRAGERLRALDFAVMASAGIAEIAIRSPRLALARATAAKTPVLNAAQATLSRCATQTGCAVRETTSLAEALNNDQCDLVIGIGGTGSGRRDDAVQDLARLGRVEAHGIAVSPGETAAFGFIGQRPVLLVPGRLDAALAVWLLLGRPLAARLTGGEIGDLPITATLRRKVASALGMTEVIPVRCAAGMADPLGSGYLSLTALARSDGWIMVGADSEGFAAGSAVGVNRWP